METQKKNWIDGFVVLNDRNNSTGRYYGSLDVYYCDLDEPPKSVYSPGERRVPISRLSMLQGSLNHELSKA